MPRPEPRPCRVADRRRASRGSLPHRRARDRERRPETRIGPMGWLHRKRDGVPGAAGESPKLRPPHRSQPAGDSRWLEGLTQGGWCAPPSARPPSCSGAKSIRRATSSSISMAGSGRGPSDPATRLSERGREDRATALTRSRAALGDRASQRGRERAGRPRRNADGAHAESLCACRAARWQRPTPPRVCSVANGT
jgi:hypothetical protein